MLLGSAYFLKSSSALCKILQEDDYKIIWWKLFNAPDSTKWTNILAVVELLFCLPVSNGHLERVFS